MDAMRKQLDMLMGANRNGDVGEFNHIHEYYDLDVCRQYLAGLCPHELFQQTKMKMGSCLKVHSLQLRKEYEEAKAKGIVNYDLYLDNALNKLVDDCKKKIDTALSLLDDEDVKAATSILVSETPEVLELSKQIKGKLKEVDDYDLEGKTDLKIRALEVIEELRNKRADSQSMLLFDALNKYRASLLSLEPIPLVTPDPRTQELINEKLNKAEELGEQGLIDEAQKAMEEAEALGKLPARQEPISESSNFTATDKKLRICDICGAFLSIYDSDRSLAEHFGGKVHQGYMQIREKLAELEVEGIKSDMIARYEDKT